MKRFIFVLSVILACLGLVAQSNAAIPEFLYIQTAKLASLKPIQGSNDSFTLTLHDVNPMMTCFAEHPQRTAGAINVNTFMEDEFLHPRNPKGNNFKNSAPNAAISAIKIANNELINIPVTLTQPQYDNKTRTLRYVVASLKGGDKLSEMELQQVSIFIDYCTNCPFRPR